MQGKEIRYISPYEITKRLLRWKWFVLTFVLSTLLTVYFGNKFLPKAYEATTLILVRSEKKPLQLERYWNPLELAMEVHKLSTLNSQIALIKSDPVLSKVVENLELYKDPVDLTWRQRITRNFFKFLLKVVGKWDPDPRRRARTALAKSLKVTRYLNESDVLVVKMQSNTANSVVATLNAVAEAYVEKAIELQMDHADRTLEFINQMISENKSELQEAERDMTALREKEGLISVDKDQEKLLGKLAQFDMDVQKTQAELASEEELLASLRSALKEEDPNVITAQITVSNPVIDDLKIRLANAQVDLAALESDSTNQPLVRKQRRKISEIENELKKAAKEVFSSRTTTKNAVYESLRTRLIDASATVYSLRARKQALMEVRDRYEREVLALPEKERRFAELFRSLSTKNEIAKTLEARRMEARIDHEQLRANLGTSIRIIQSASPPFKARKPRELLNLFIALMVSLLVGLAMVIVLENLDRSISNASDIEQLLGQTVLAVVPPIKEYNGKAYCVSPSVLRQDGIPDTFNRLRITIRYKGLQNVPILVTTSSRKGEGASTVAANLAVALASVSSNKVLLIDANLRDPALHSIFSIPGTRGLGDLLTDEFPMLNTAVVPTDLPNLSLLPSGTRCEDPSFLVSSERMTGILDQARRNYEAVIVDSPPVMESSDSQTLAQQSTGVLFVIQAGNVHLESLKTAIKELQKVEAKIIGTVLNYRPVTRPLIFRG